MFLQIHHSRGGVTKTNIRRELMGEIQQHNCRITKEKPLALPSVPHLFVDILQQGFTPVLRLLAILLQGVGVPEVRLGVDVVEPRLQHHQFPVQQLDVLEERQALLTLPP
ncbi:hypothetical protein ILYODFUR_021296 [Ilyodon furcidens]|uniref:Uncharacterized protein n=1 Tax=Ilyodon furcidens TaxID=33524 RepID=A0ABV0V4Y2_9TELE